jgi:hypothetical protein
MYDSVPAITRGGSGSERRPLWEREVLWARMHRLIDRWLPPARTCHPYPLRRMGVIT